MNRQGGLFACTLIACGLLTAGCSTMRKATGTEEVRMAAPPDRVIDAAKAAVKELELDLIYANASKLDGEIEARTGQGKVVKIKVKSEGLNVSRVSVHVGTLGDDDISNAIINATRKNLEKR